MPCVRLPCPWAQAHCCTARPELGFRHCLLDFKLSATIVQVQGLAEGRLELHSLWSILLACVLCVCKHTSQLTVC